MTQTLTKVEKVTVRRPAVITEGNGDINKFQKQVDEFTKANKVVEKYMSFSMIPIERKATMIQGVGRGVNLQMQMVPVCYMVIEVEEIPGPEPVKLHTL